MVDFLNSKNNSFFLKDNFKLNFYIPEKYFDKYATQMGDMLDVIGVFLYDLMDKNGKKLFSKPKLFNYPTRIKVKVNKLEKSNDESLYGKYTYRVLSFDGGDLVLPQDYTIEDAQNLEAIVSLFLHGNLPRIIPYEELQELFHRSAHLNGVGFGHVYALDGVMVSELCRDPQDISKPFYMGYISGKYGSTDYKVINIDDLPKYISSYASLASHNTSVAMAGALTTASKEASSIEQVFLSNLVKKQ